MKIAFCWEGINTYRHRLTDGLGEALKLLREKHDIRYFEPYDAVGIHGFRPDVVLHWAPLCGNDHDAVINLPYKKAICFGGGPIDESNVHGYDLYFTESEINEKELTEFKKPWKRAFGINEKLFSPTGVKKLYDGAFLGTFAKWKRPELFAQALGPKGVAAGIWQDHEPECYRCCLDSGVTTLKETDRETAAGLINQSHTVVNPADYWGGGQRLTLEAMACNIPPIVMKDSPKNREYVEDSHFGLVVDPDPEAIREAVAMVKSTPWQPKGRDYVLSKYSSENYAKQLDEGLRQLC